MFLFSDSCMQNAFMFCLCVRAQGCLLLKKFFKTTHTHTIQESPFIKTITTISKNTLSIVPLVIPIIV